MTEELETQAEKIGKTQGIDISPLLKPAASATSRC
jgi:hypothetical protein